MGSVSGRVAFLAGGQGCASVVDEDVECLRGSGRRVPRGVLVKRSSALAKQHPSLY